MSNLDDIGAVTADHIRRADKGDILGETEFIPDAAVARRSGRPVRAIPLLLIDAMMLTRECFAHTLKSSAREFTVQSVARVGSGDEPVLQMPPQIVLLNIQSARVGDAWVRDDIEMLRRRYGDVPLIILTERDDSDWTIEAIRYGLRGYIPMSLNINIVIAAIRLVLAGGTFVPTGVVHDYANLAAREQAVDAADSALTNIGFTEREIEVLDQLQQGKANKVIAYELDISESTVKVHVRHIMKKLRATNRTQVVFLAQKALASKKALAVKSA